MIWEQFHMKCSLYQLATIYRNALRLLSHDICNHMFFHISLCLITSKIFNLIINQSVTSPEGYPLSFKVTLMTNRKTLSASRVVRFKLSKQSMPSIFDISFFVDVLMPVVAMLSVVWQVMAFHYCDVIMAVMASKITSLAIYSTVYSYVDQRKHQSSASLVFVRGLHRWPVNSPHKWPVNVSIWWCHHGSSAWAHEIFIIKRTHVIILNLTHYYFQNFSTPIEIRTQISWKDMFAVLAISFPNLWTFVTKNSR